MARVHSISLLGALGALASLQACSSGGSSPKASGSPGAVPTAGPTPNQAPPVTAVPAPSVNSTNVAPNLSANGPSAQCQASWANWQKTYASSSPFAAYNKTATTWPIAATGLQAVVNGSTLVSLPTTMYAQGQSYNAFDIGRSPLSLAESTRDANIRSHIEALVQASKTAQAQPSSTHELLIVFTQFNHAVDYFLDSKDTASFFANYPVVTTTPTQTESMFTLQGMLQGAAVARPLMQDNFASTYAQPFEKLSYYSRVLSQPFDVAGTLLADNAVSSNAIVLSDYSGIRESSVTDNLPAADCLRSLGYTSVQLALEGFTSGTQIQDANVMARIDYNAALSDAQRAQIQASNPQAFQYLTTTQGITAYPEYLALLQKVQAYRAGGLTLTYSGLE